MSTNSNQGPPDLDVVFRQLFSFLFKKRKQRKKAQEQNPLKRLLEQGKKRRLEKKHESGQTATTKNDNWRAPRTVQSQNRVKETVSQTRVEPATIKSDTRKTVAQQISDYQQSRPRPTEPSGAGKVVGQNVNANSTREWFHDSRALRQAFVLKELLEPPIALRKRPRRHYS